MKQAPWVFEQNEKRRKYLKKAEKFLGQFNYTPTAARALGDFMYHLRQREINEREEVLTALRVMVMKWK